MTISFGNPGDLRKTFDDGKFDLVNGVYNKIPCKLAAGVAAANIVDGLFLMPDGKGRFVPATDADTSLALIFTANSEVMVKSEFVDATNPATYTNVPFPGEERTDAPTGLIGTIEGVWPAALLDGGVAALATYAANTPLTVKNGKLAVGDPATDKIIGRVEAPSTWAGGGLGAQAIAARVTLS